MRLSRWLARVWILAGLVGVIATVLVVGLGWQLIATFRESTERTLDLLGATLETTSKTTTTAIDTLTLTEDGMLEAELALQAAGDGLGQLNEVMTAMAFVLGGEVPATLEAVAASFPAMIDTARVIDRTMEALSFLGVEYQPEVPLDESLTAVEAELLPLATELRGQAVPLAEAAGQIELVGDSVETVGARVADITAQLSGSRDLVQEYEQAAADAGALITDLRNRLDSQVLLARALLGALGLVGLVLMSVPIALGRAALGASDVE